MVVNIDYMKIGEGGSLEMGIYKYILIIRKDGLSERGMLLEHLQYV